MLSSYLGIRKVIWLSQSLAGAHGESPVDDLAIFARPGVVLALACSDSADANHGALADTVARLRSETDAAGRVLDVITIEQPRARYMENGDRLNLSYVDCYIANGAVIMPVFEDPQDARAYELRQGVPRPGDRADSGDRYRLRRRRLHAIAWPAGRARACSAAAAIAMSRRRPP